MLLSPDPSTLPTREAVRSVLIRRDLDRYIRRHLLTSVPNPIQSVGLGMALIMVSGGIYTILQDTQEHRATHTIIIGLVPRTSKPDA